MRVVDESSRLVGLWRVSIGLQDGAQAGEELMALAGHTVDGSSKSASRTT